MVEQNKCSKVIVEKWFLFFIVFIWNAIRKRNDGYVFVLLIINDVNANFLFTTSTAYTESVTKSIRRHFDL